MRDGRRRAGAQIVLHTPVLVSKAARAYRAELPRYCQAAREIAADSGAVLVDHEAHWLARFADQDPIAWLDDPDHPNAADHPGLESAVPAAGPDAAT
jgi:acyl-CoA thioesterase I